MSSDSDSSSSSSSSSSSCDSGNEEEVVTKIVNVPRTIKTLQRSEGAEVQSSKVRGFFKAYSLRLVQLADYCN